MPLSKTWCTIVVDHMKHTIYEMNKLAKCGTNHVDDPEFSWIDAHFDNKIASFTSVFCPTCDTGWFLSSTKIKYGRILYPLAYKLGFVIQSIPHFSPIVNFKSDFTQCKFTFTYKSTASYHWKSIHAYMHETTVYLSQFTRVVWRASNSTVLVCKHWKHWPDLTGSFCRVCHRPLSRMHRV